MCERPRVETGASWTGWSNLPGTPARTGRGPWTDLTHPVSPSVPRAPVFDSPRFTRIAEIATHGMNITRMEMVVHAGTHVDAPAHFCSDGPGVDAIPVERLTGEGVVIGLNPSACEAITAEHLASAAPTIEPGDIVAIDTGWSARWGSPDWTRHPYLSAEATDWLIRRRVKLVAVDTIDPEMPDEQRPATFDFPVHGALLSRGILIAEQLANLDALRGRRVEFVFSPIPIVGSDGAPARVLARPLD